MFPFETNYCRVFVDDTKQIGILSWNRPVSLPEYKKGLSALVELLKTYGLQRTLIDSTQKGPLSFEADEWVFKSLPQEVEGVNLTNHQVALVMTEDMYQDMVQQYTILRSGTLKIPLSINYFTKFDEALHWLAHEPSVLN